MKRIIVPTDFSVNARNAFNYAYSNYGTDVEYVLLNTYEAPNAGNGMLVSIDEILEKESIKGLKVEFGILSEMYPDANIVTESVYGAVEDGIRRVNNKKECHIVVIGTTGASGLKGVFLGSNAERVIRESILPVLAIPAECHKVEMNKFVFAADFKTIHHESTFDPLLDFVNQHNGTVDIVHVHDPELDDEQEHSLGREQLKTIFSAVNYKVEEIPDDNVLEAVDEYIDTHDVDVLVVIPRKTSFFKRLFKKSISKGLAYSTKVPLLTLKD